MKYRLFTWMAVLTLATVAGGLCYRMASEQELRDVQGDPMKWLQVEFHLSADQFARIEKLHRDYSEVCAGHCRAIQVAMDTVEDLRTKNPASSTLIADREKRVRDLERECEGAIEKHIREVAACMNAHDGQRYLTLVLPRISGYDHSGPPDLGLRR